MARKIVDTLFQKQNDSATEESKMYISMKDWKYLLSRLEHTENQIDTYNKKVDSMYSKIMQWMERMREKIDSLSKSQKKLNATSNKMFQEWEQKILSWIQPEQRKEDQRKVMDLMQRHSQFIMSYDKELNQVKKTLSKNDYQIYQMLEQIRSIRIEMDIVGQHKEFSQSVKNQSVKNPARSNPRSEVSL